MSLSVIATVYLDKTDQWESVGFEKRDEAVQHIKNGKLIHTILYKVVFGVWQKLFMVVEEISSKTFVFGVVQPTDMSWPIVKAMDLFLFP